MNATGEEAEKYLAEIDKAGDFYTGFDLRKGKLSL